jgi:DNA replication protein
MDVDWRKLLIKHYKSPTYKLNENEVVVLLCLDDILSSNKILVTGEDLVNYMTLTSEEIDEILSSLLEKKYIDYIRENNKTITSIEPIKNKIFEDLKRDIIIESNETSTKENKEKVDNLYSYFESQLGRVLTGKEIDRISTWVRSGASEGMIKEAVEKVKAKGKTLSMNAVDKVLLSIQKSNDITKEGYSTMSSSYRHSDEETIDIVTKSWVPKEK